MYVNVMQFKYMTWYSRIYENVFINIDSLE